MGDRVGRLLPFNALTNLECGYDVPLEVANTSCTSGLSRIKAYADDVAATRNVVFVDAGGSLTGSLWDFVSNVSLKVDIYNAVQFDAIGVNGYELNEGAAYFEDLLAETNVTALTSNFNLVATNTSVGAMFKTIPFPGETVGLCGVVDNSLIQKVKDSDPFYISEDMWRSLRSCVGSLRDDLGVDVVVALLPISNIELQFSQLRQVSGLDVAVVLSDSPLPDYPTVITAESGSPLLLVSQPEFASGFGHLTVEFNSFGKVTGWNGSIVELPFSAPVNAAVETVLSAAWPTLERRFNESIAVAAADFPFVRDDMRSKETALGDLIGESLLEYARALPGHADTQFAVVNGGSVRAGFAQGDIPLSALYSAVPFAPVDLMYTFSLRGSTLKKIMENAVSRADNATFNLGTGRFLQIAGMRFAWNPAEAVGQRVFDLEVGGAKVQPSGVYKGISIDYIVLGLGDDYDLAGLPAELVELVRVDDLLDTILRDYLTTNSPVTPALDGRIALTTKVFVNDTGDSSGDDNGDGKSGAEVGAIVGGSLGGAALLVLLCALCLAPLLLLCALVILLMAVIVIVLIILVAAVIIVLAIVLGVIVPARRGRDGAAAIVLEEPDFATLPWVLSDLRSVAADLNAPLLDPLPRDSSQQISLRAKSAVSASFAKLTPILLSTLLSFVSKKEALIALSSAVGGEQVHALAESLVLFLHAQRGAAKSINMLLMWDLRASGSIFLREDTLATMSFRVYARLVGCEFLWHALAYPVAEIVQNVVEEAAANASTSDSATASTSLDTGTSDMAGGKSQSVLRIGGSIQLDPNRLGDDAESGLLELNLLKIQLIVQSVLLRLQKFAPSALSPELRFQLYDLRKRLRKGGFSAPSETVVASLFFLRFIGVSLVAPHLYGLMEAPPPADAFALLILVSKVLQKLSNNALYEEESYMAKLNDFLSANRKNFDRFIDEISQKCEEPSTPNPMPSKEFNYLSTLVLLSVIVKNQEAIQKKLNEFDKKTSSTLSSKLDYIVKNAEAMESVASPRAESTRQISSSSEVLED